MTDQTKDNESIPRGGGDASGKSITEIPRGGGDASGKAIQTDQKAQSSSDAQSKEMHKNA